MELSLGDAAKRINVSKTTIWRAVKKGEISATRDADGSYRVDASELHRVAERLALRHPPQAAADSAVTGVAGDTIETRLRLASVEAELKAALQMLDVERRRGDEIRQDRDEWKTTAQRLLIAAPIIPAAPLVTPAPATAPAPQRASWWRWWWKAD